MEEEGGMSSGERRHEGGGRRSIEERGWLEGVKGEERQGQKEDKGNTKKVGDE